MRGPRIVILGMDGVPYGMLKDLSERNVMPNIKGLISKGVFKKINSALPEVSCVAWSSIITGRNPGEHGIYGFTDIERGTYRLRFPNFEDLKAPPFWARFKKLKYAILNVPSTYPALPLNGVLVSGFVSIDMRKAIYPSSLLSVLKKLSYRIDVNSEKAHKDMDGFIEDLSATLQSSVRLYRHLWKKLKWDVFMYVFTVTDRLMHFLWNAYEDESNKYHTAFLGCLKNIDRVIGEIQSELNEDDLLFIFSDHGFEQLKRDVYINLVLQEGGFLEKEIVDDLSRMTVNTKAFALDPARIYINEAESYKRGGVLLKERESVIKGLQQLFYSLRVDGKKVIKKIYRKEEIYRGHFLNRAPDLLLVSHEGFNLKAALSSRAVYSTGVFTGKHTYEGAFFLAGPSAGEGQLKEGSVVGVGRMIEKTAARYEKRKIA